MNPPLGQMLSVMVSSSRVSCVSSVVWVVWVVVFTGSAPLNRIGVCARIGACVARE